MNELEKLCNDPDLEILLKISHPFVIKHMDKFLYKV
jgi:serine/threonine protein kinase